MSASQSRSRRLVSPVTSKKGRDMTEVPSASQNSVQLQNGHSNGLANSSDAFTTSTASTISMPRIDSCILGKETLEQREKFTVSKIVRYFVDIAQALSMPALYFPLTVKVYGSCSPKLLSLLSFSRLK